MHHFGEDAIQIFSTERNVYIIITNKETGQEVSVNIPRYGVFIDPRKDLSLEDANRIAREFAHTLGKFLA